MMRRCEDCQKGYDDFDHWTFCPHERFPTAEERQQGLKDLGILDHEGNLTERFREFTRE